MTLGVHVHCTASGPLLLQVQLTLSDAFEYAIVGADPALEKTLAQWLNAYAQKKPFPLSLPCPNLPPFHQRALAALAQVPFGAILSYRDLAAQCGNPLAARAIGNACKGNPFPLLIPCHRVIRSDGSVGGFALDQKIKQRLLAFEGSKP